MAEDNANKSKRDITLERLKVKYPDGNFEDDEAIFSQINDDYDSYDNELATYKEHEKGLADMFSADPRSAAFLTDWRDGEDPVVGLVRKFGVEIKDVLDDPEMQEKIAEANKEYLERVAQEKELEETYQANLVESLETISSIQEEKGYSDEQIDQAFEWLMGVIQDGVVGKFTPEIIDMAMKAQNYDADVAQAEAEGEVKGRNARIKEQLRTRKQGDGIAALDGKSGVTQEGEPMPNMGVIGRYGDSMQSIWERGGEKRTKYNN